MTRVQFYFAVALACVLAMKFADGAPKCTNGRPPKYKRKFVSKAVDDVISEISSKMKDKTLSCLFSNTLPNTLDTTAEFEWETRCNANGTCDNPEPLSFVITGDIDAMWLRDSMNQVLPYMEFAAQDDHLKNFLAGLINRQTKQILADVYANSHSKSVTSAPSPHTDDQTTSPGFLGTRLDAMVPGIFERKYELDSLCAFLKLSRSYFEKTADQSPFDADWIKAVALVIDTIVDQQKSSEDDPDPIYQFQRQALEPTDTLLHAVGAPAAYTGMSKSAFRPSDDATTFPFLVPANAMAVVELREVASLLTRLQQQELALKSTQLADEIDNGIKSHGGSSTVFSYEVDGFGNRLFMDDANVPSLLSLPYLGYLSMDDPKYQRTRKMVLSTSTNPYFFNGTAGQGVGGPHVGLNRIWPMSIMIRALTTDDDAEISDCLEMLKASSAGTGFMHESFSKDDVNVYSRSWFAWANSLFGELILDLRTRKPHLIF